jgi:hypothetical protein
LIHVGVSEGATAEGATTEGATAEGAHAALLLSMAVGRCGRACSALLIHVGVSDGATAALPWSSPLDPDSAEATAVVPALPAERS